MVDEEINPLAENLLGKIINGIWMVEKKYEKGNDETGGMFSVGYEVKDGNGNIAFLKAFNFKEVFRNKENMMEILNVFSEAYVIVMQEFKEKLNTILDSKIVDEILSIIDEMCTQDKSKRGDPELIKRKSNKKYELQRYMTRIDKIIKKLEIAL